MYASQAPPPGRIDILLLAPTAPELVGFRPTLTERLDGNIRGLHVVGKTVGVGMAVASGSASVRLSDNKPRAVIFIGTCGVYPGLPQYRPHDVVVGGRLHLLDHAVVARRSAFPEPMQTSVDCHSVLAAGLSASGQRIRVAPIATPLATTTDDTTASHVPGATGCEAESLEAFAVGLASHLAHVPFAAVLGVTNVVGSRGRDDWMQFQRQSVIAAAETVLAWIHNGAHGLPATAA